MQKNEEYRELDVWRGIAIIFMITNHAGVVFLSDGDMRNLYESTIVFIGSFAPVLFFLITGFGYGLSFGKTSFIKTPLDKALPDKALPDKAIGKHSRGSVWYKASILILMDILLRGGHVDIFGWDFLGFIAMSMIIVNMVMHGNRPVFLAVVLMTIVVFMRFIVGPAYSSMVPQGQQSALITALLGMSSFSDISYWFAPWLFYPLLGFVAGYYYIRHRKFLVSRKRSLTFCLAAGAIVFLAASLVLKLNDMIFFRWGTVSAAFFILGFAVLLLTAILSWLVCIEWKMNRLTRLVAKRGVGCLIMVPIHYAIIYYSKTVFSDPMSAPAFTLYLTGVIISSYLIAHYFENLSKMLASTSVSTVIISCIVSVVILMLLLINVIPLQSSFKNAAIFGAEILLCLLLPIQLNFFGKSSRGKANLAAQLQGGVIKK